MKRIVLICDVKDEDADEVVSSAREVLPTWKVSVVVLDETYRVRLHCSNCSHFWYVKTPIGTKASEEVICPSCGCETGGEVMTAKLKIHIVRYYEDTPHPDNKITYCGKIVHRQRRIKLADNWDKATCLKCIELAEEDKPKWKHLSHRS